MRTASPARRIGFFFPSARTSWRWLGKFCDRAVAGIIRTNLTCRHSFLRALMLGFDTTSAAGRG
jgi:hypothetical protein